MRTPLVGVRGPGSSEATGVPATARTATLGWLLGIRRTDRLSHPLDTVGEGTRLPAGKGKPQDVEVLALRRYPI